MANSLLIEKQTGGYFKFTLNGDTANAITSIQNDLLAVGNQLHFKTGNGANIIKEQFIYPEDVTIISGGTFTFTTVAQVWDKLIDIDYFAWLGGGGGIGIDRFDDLVDTFKYTGNAGKTVIVDNSELRLVPVTLYNKRLFTELEDTPDSLVPNKMVVVNSAGDALILKDQPEAPETLLNSVGYFDYNDLITQTVPLNAVSNVALKLTNDSEGANTSTDQNPYGVSYVWDYTTNQFNFSELSIGDTIDVRIHLQVTTTTSNQRVLLSAKLGIGSIAEFTNIIYENQFKSAGLHEINFVAPFYIGSTYISDNPAELYLTTDASATVKVDGWYVRIIRKDINIVTVDYTVPDATTLAKGIVRLAGDLGGTANSPTVPGLANKVSTSRTIGTTSPLLGGGALSSDLILSIQQANSTDSGYLSYVDWGHFDTAHNDRIVSADVTGTTTKTLTLNQHDGGTITANWSDIDTPVTIGTANGLSLSGQELSLGLASTSSTGALTSTDWSTFNNKQAALNGTGFVKISGTAISYDNNTYALDNAVVHLAGSETISGNKTFTGSSTVFDYTGASRLIFKESGTEVGDFSFSPYFTQFTSKASGGYIFKNSLNNNSLTISNSGNGAFLGSLTATSIIKSGGTSSQYLMADGSVSTLTNPVTASSATANYHAKFTGSGYAIGNSIVWDNGTNVGIGTTSPDNGKLTILKNTSRATESSYGIAIQSNALNAYTELLLGADDTVDCGVIQTAGKNTSFTSKKLALQPQGGNVGIGTTSPSEKLEVLGNIRLTNNNLTTANTVSSEINNFNGSSNQFKSSSIKFLTGSFVDQGHITFNTSIGGVDQERLRIAESGNVGIGTTSPSKKLHVKGGNDNVLFLDNGGEQYTTQYFANNGTTKSFLVWDNTSSLFEIGTAVSADLRLLTNNSERMRITSGGNVGIGTTSPDGTLTVAKSSPSSYVISSIRNLNSGVGGGVQGTQLNFYGDVGYSINTPTSYIQSTSNDGGSSGQGSLRFGNYNGSTSVECMRITSGGNVGIGTTSPSAKLNVSGDIHLGSYSDTSINTYEIRTNKALFSIASDGVTNGNGTLITYSWANGGQGPLRFNNASGEVMRLSSDGKLIIGTSSSIGSGIFQVKTSSANNVAHFQNGTSDAGYGLVFLNVAGSAVGSIGWTNVMTSYNVTSDYRLKEDFKDYSGLDLISKIKTYDYKWKGIEDRMYGVKAHELQEVLPYAVNGEKDAEQMQQVDYSKLVPILVQAIQELKQEIEILKNK